MMTNYVKWIARCEEEYLTLFFGGTMVNRIRNLPRQDDALIILGRGKSFRNHPHSSTSFQMNIRCTLLAKSGLWLGRQVWL